MELMECLVSNRATLLALHGFAAYALPYFSFGDLPRGANKLDIYYFEEALRAVFIPSKCR